MAFPLYYCPSPNIFLIRHRYILSCLWGGAYKLSLVANRKAYLMKRDLLSHVSNTIQPTVNKTFSLSFFFHSFFFHFFLSFFPVKHIPNSYLSGPLSYIRHQITVIKYVECGVRSWCDGSSDRYFMMDPLSYFSFQPVLHDWSNKGRGMLCVILSVGWCI